MLFSAKGKSADFSVFFPFSLLQLSMGGRALADKDLKKPLRIFDITRDGRGISKKTALNGSGLKRFFITYKDNFGKLVSTNIFFVLGNFPLFFLVAVLSGLTKAESLIPSSDLFQNLGALFMTNDPTPYSMTLYALEGLHTEVLVNTALSYVFYGISALALFTFGLVNVGTAYILRNIAKGEPVFLWTDFFYAIKRNWKQALPFGMIDAAICALLGFNVYWTIITADGGFLQSMMFWANIVVIIIYFFMRCYIYVQMVTFKLSVYKILKNSLIFSLIGLKRNILALLGSLVLILFEIMFIFSLGGVLVPLAVAMPLAIAFSTMAYMKVYASYFKIKEIMIDPYMEEHPEEFPEEEPVEVIMRDDVSESERLAEIKKKNGIN